MRSRMAAALPPPGGDCTTTLDPGGTTLKNPGTTLNFDCLTAQLTHAHHHEESKQHAICLEQAIQHLSCASSSNGCHVTMRQRRPYNGTCRCTFAPPCGPAWLVPYRASDNTSPGDTWDMATPSIATQPKRRHTLVYAHRPGSAPPPQSAPSHPGLTRTGSCCTALCPAR